MSHTINTNVPSLHELAGCAFANQQLDSIIKNPTDKTYCSHLEERDSDLKNNAKEAWDCMKQVSSQTIGENLIMQNIENALIRDYCKNFRIDTKDGQKIKFNAADLDPEAKKELLINNVHVLFQKLAEKIGATQGFSSWKDLQKQWEDEALVILYTDFIRKNALCESQAPELTSAEDIRAWMKDHKDLLSKINKLTLCHAGLKVIPPEIEYFSELAFLKLDHNEIYCIPEYVSKCPKLLSLCLPYNQISCIPDTISSCNKLFGISVAHNELSFFPDALAQAPELECVNAKGNHINKIPTSLKLSVLNLKDNPLFLHFRQNVTDQGLVLEREKVNSMISKEKAFWGYQCQKTFSCFMKNTLHFYIIDRPDQIQKEFHQYLNDSDKDLVRKAYCNLTNQNNISSDALLFEDIDLFCKAVFQVNSLKFDALTKEKQAFALEMAENSATPLSPLVASDVLDEIIQCNDFNELYNSFHNKKG